MPVRKQSAFIAPAINDLYQDPISKMASEYWSFGGSIPKDFDSSIIEKIYQNMVKNTEYMLINLFKEQSASNYDFGVHKNFNKTSVLHKNLIQDSTSHVLSIVLLINEKARGNIYPWTIFSEHAEYVGHFFLRIYQIALDKSLSHHEHCFIVEFLIVCINSLEVDIVREQLRDIISISSWSYILPNRLDYELNKNKIYKKLYKKCEEKSKKLVGNAKELFDMKSSFISKYIEIFLCLLEDIDESLIQNSRAMSFIHFFMYLLIELESLLSTRRFFHVLLDDHQVVVKTRLCKLYGQNGDKIFTELWEILKFYSKIEVDELKGTELNHAQLLQLHYSELTRLQKIAFLKFKNEMKEFYLSPSYRIDSREALTKHLSNLCDESLHLFSHHCNIIVFEHGHKYNREFLIELLTYKYEKSSTLLQQINKTSLYPDEQLLWYRPKIPDEDWSGNDCLPLPKLNLQFLTLNDYLWRNFMLFSLESTYSIKADIEDAIVRMKPWMNEMGDTEFAGWARMALPLKEFAVTTVGPTDVSTSNPQYVYADLTVSTRMRESFRQEWISLKKYDPVFLLHIEFDNVGINITHDDIFPRKYGIISVRGAEIIGLVDDDGKVIDEGIEYKPKGIACNYRVALDPNQYQIDVNNNIKGETVYHNINVIVRRKPKENNFKAVLETIRTLMNTECLIPEWLGDIFLGYGDPSSAHYSNLPQSPIIDFYDTFLNSKHIMESFPNYKINFTSNEDSNFWKISITDGVVNATPYFSQKSFLSRDDCIKLNTIQYTPRQIEAIKSGLQHGLSLIVGPPGTSKTDVAVQIISTIYNTHPNERTLIVTHSNQALNQIFDKIVNLDVDEIDLIRLGHGEEELATTKDFSRRGRVNYILARRLELIQRLVDLQKSLGIEGMTQHTCETASNFFTYQILPKIDEFNQKMKQSKEVSDVASNFPFTAFISTITETIFLGQSYEEDMETAAEYIQYVENIFTELSEYRPFELLRTVKDRSNYLITKTCRIIAMTCVHAALKRKDLVDLRFQYDNIIMEEAAQILEIETFIPLMLQNTHDGCNKLKRIILIGDHNQLPPVIRNRAFQKFSNMEQSLFARLIRFGVPCVELDKQGRCRPSICDLFNWRYSSLSSLPSILNSQQYKTSNTGFLYEYQLINVEDFQGVGESEPTLHFVQNLGEAEYAASLFVYMRMCGYPAEKISILTTYNGQKHLIRDIIRKKCSTNALIGEPQHISTVDRFQGQQNDYIILSLVRTKTVGYLRDVRRLIVALSRARLGLYVLARTSIFSCCYELMPSFKKLLQYPTDLCIVLNEPFPTNRTIDETKLIPNNQIKSFSCVEDFISFVHKFYLSVAYNHQLEEKQLEEERLRILELQKKEHEAYLKEVEELAEANSRRYEGLIQNEVIADEDAQD